jgi:hypothetical protein
MRQRTQDLVDSGVDEAAAQAQVEAEFAENSPTFDPSRQPIITDATLGSQSLSQSQTENEVGANAVGHVEQQSQPADVVGAEKEQMAAAEQDRQTTIERMERERDLAALEERARIAAAAAAAAEQERMSLERQRIAALEAELEVRAAAEREAFQRAAAEKEAARLAAVQQAMELDRRRVELDIEKRKKAEAEEEEKLALRRQREEAVRKAKQRQQEEEQALAQQGVTSHPPPDLPESEKPSSIVHRTRKEDDSDLVPLDDQILSQPESLVTQSLSVTQRRYSKDDSPKLVNAEDEPSLLSIGSAAPSTPLLPSRSRGPCPCSIL